MDPGTAITPLVLSEYCFDLLEQGRICFLTLARPALPTVTPMVVAAFGHLQHPAKHADRIFVFVRFDEGAFQVVCFAK